jgi:hypothetical protein
MEIQVVTEKAHRRKQFEVHVLNLNALKVKEIGKSGKKATIMMKPSHDNLRAEVSISKGRIATVARCVI